VGHSFFKAPSSEAIDGCIIPSAITLAISSHYYHHHYYYYYYYYYIIIIIIIIRSLKSKLIEAARGDEEKWIQIKNLSKMLKNLEISPKEYFHQFLMMYGHKATIKLFPDVVQVGGVCCVMDDATTL